MKRFAPRAVICIVYICCGLTNHTMSEGSSHCVYHMCGSPNKPDGWEASEGQIHDDKIIKLNFSFEEL